MGDIADLITALRARTAQPVGVITVQDAAKVLLDAMTAKPALADPFDACDPEVERLAIEYSGQGGDAVIVLETAEKFMLAGLRALLPEGARDDRPHPRGNRARRNTTNLHDCGMRLYGGVFQLIR